MPMEKTQSERLQEARLKLGFKRVTKFAEKLDVSSSAIQKIENGGKISFETAMNIEKIHGINHLWLLTGEGEMQLDSPKDGKNNLHSKESEAFANAVVERIENYFLEERNFLKEQIKIKDETINKLLAKLWANDKKSYTRVPQMGKPAVSLAATA
jgi:transcriptional regulator with XRE-family HTH domain